MTRLRRQTSGKRKGSYSFGPTPPGNMRSILDRASEGYIDFAEGPYKKTAQNWIVGTAWSSSEDKQCSSAR
ncbi:hypothetical protein chiPu_0003756 [Chiloscyllium punctatum]|uniref:Uncharacterized protein n=1 Tax=Chiloscyllium punctatum TaxID=137246 RepID=A0A401S4M3_CHIPU|nr:hypothetical protein [Chiloscyllium punctatum]